MQKLSPTSAHQVFIEIERKYDVADLAVIPDLTGIPSIASQSQAQQAILDAVYFDTDQCDLAAERIVLRRRSGGHDEGWHVKFPGSEGRVEWHWPLSAESDIPDAVRQLVLVHVRNKKLRAIARIKTVRTVVGLADASGAVIAEVCDDVVSADDLLHSQHRTWREWEVELADSAPSSPKKRTVVLDLIEKQLEQAGATPSTSVSKLARALGDTVLGNAQLSSTDCSGTDPVSHVLTVMMAQCVSELKTLDPLVRYDAAESIHEMRSVLQRLRSIFTTHPLFFSPPKIAPLRVLSKMFEQKVRRVCDAYTLHERARNLVRSQQDKEMHRGVLDRVVRKKEQDYLAALAQLNVALSEEPYFHLLDALDECVTQPPFSQASSQQADHALAYGIAREYDRLKQRIVDVSAAANAQQWNRRIRLVRKSAHRFHSALQAVTSDNVTIFDGKVRRLAVVVQNIQRALDELWQSSRVQELLVSCAAEAAAEAENTFGYGRLHAIEQRRSDAALEEYSRACAALSGAKKWLPTI